MDVSKTDSSDLSPTITAALAALFQTHPNRDALMRVWEPIATSMPVLAIQAGKTDVARNANVVLAQMLLDVLRGDGIVQSEGPPTAG